MNFSIKFEGDILSFYDYDEVDFLLKFKYHKFGSRIFWILSKPLKEFAKNFQEKAYLIPIDDNPKKGYSHTAILAKAMQTQNLKPLFNSLRAKNDVKYAGKSLEFRLKNKRDFEYKGKRGIDVILVDDIVTTKTTLNEAIEVLKKSEVNVLFSVVLARR